MTCPFCGALSGKSSTRDPCVLLVQQLNQVVFGKGGGKEMGMPMQLRQRLACTPCFAKAVQGETMRGYADGPGGEAHDIPVFPELLAGLRQAAPWAEATSAEDVAQARRESPINRPKIGARNSTGGSDSGMGC